MDVIFKIFLVVLGLGFIIFVHELGHFLVAKWCRVRCEVFSCGFGHPILWWRPTYPWRPGAPDFKYNDVLGKELLTDSKKLREALATKGGSRVGNRLRILKWPVEKLAPGMVNVCVINDAEGKEEGISPVLLDEAKIAEIKASGVKTVEIFDAGETEYRLSWIPLGGYVAMAGGETPGEGNQGLPDEFLSKTPGQRAAILIAGVTMNAITAVALFFAAYAIGVETPPSVVGDAMATMPTADNPHHPGPAWVAGLRPGDRIVNMHIRKKGDPVPPDVREVNDDLDFNEFRVSVAFTDHDDIIRVGVLRPVGKYGGTEGTVTATGETAAPGEGGYNWVFLDIEPVYHVEQGFMGIGVMPMATPQVDAIVPDREEVLRGKLQLKDMVVAVDGHELAPAVPMLDRVEDPNKPWPRSYIDFERRLREVKGDDVTLTVIRNGQRVQTTVPYSTHPTRVRLGLDALPVVPAAAVRPGGPAAEAVKAVQTDDGEWVMSEETFGMRAGDTVVAVQGERAHSFEHLVRMVQTLTANQPARVTIARPPADSTAPAVETEIFVRPSMHWRTGQLALEFIPDHAKAEADDKVTHRAMVHGIDPRGPAAQAEFVSATNVPEGVEVEQRLLPGDVVLQVNERPVVRWDATEDSVMAVVMGGWDRRSLTAAPVRLTVQRALAKPDAPADAEPVRAQLTFQVTPTAYAEDLQRSIGFNPAMTMITVHHTGLKGIEVGLWKTWMMGKQVFLTLRSIFVGTVAAKNIGGPVLIATASYRFAGWGIGTFLYFMAIISINLAIINLLPIPVLDGGHLVFVGIEKLRGKPVPEHIQGWATMVGLLMILALLVFVMYNDINRLITGF